MSEHLAAAAQALNAPEVLVQRSAEARAKATGSSIDDVLAAWAGGRTAAAAPVAAAVPATPAVPEPQAIEPEVTPQPSADVPGPGAAPAEVPAVATGVVVLVEETPVETVEAAPLRDRIRRSSRVGAVVGLAMGLLVVLFASQWLVPRATSVEIGGTTGAAIDVVGGWLVVGLGLISAAAGAVVAGASRMVTGWFGGGLQLANRPSGTMVVGAMGGLVTGAALGSVLLASGTPNDLAEGVTTVPLMGSVLWTLAGWTAGGWLIGVLVQAFAVPRGVESGEAEESSGVKDRLATAYGLPAVAAVAILLLVLPVAYVFISYPEWAPLTGVFVAASILGFAGLSASRPGMRITGGEFLAAAAGVAVVVIVIVAVLAIQGGGGHGEEGHGEGEAVAAVVAV